MEISTVASRFIKANILIRSLTVLLYPRSRRLKYMSFTDWKALTFAKYPEFRGDKIKGGEIEIQPKILQCRTLVI